MKLFTTAEAASYLRLKERKIYEMVAEGTVPCTKVTGRWLFPKAELDHWLTSSITRPAGMTRPDPAPIVGGSHDPLLEWALRESGSGLATLAIGSEAGLARFLAGEAVGTRIRPIQAAQDVQKRRFARAGRPHDRDILARSDREIQFLEGIDGAASDKVRAPNPGQLDHFSASAATTTRAPALTSGRSSDTTTSSLAERPVVISV